MAEKKTRGPSYDRELLVSKIAMMRINSKSTSFILDFLMNDIGMSRAVAYEVLGDAQKYITETTQKDFEDSFNEAVQQLEEQLQRESKNSKVWLEIRKELNKLKGLHRPQRVDITSNGKTVGVNIIVKSDEDKKNIEDNL